MTTAQMARRRTRRPELAYLVAAGQTLAVTAVLALPIAGLAAGMPGLFGAGVALALVGALFGLSSLLHVLAAPFRAQLWMLLTVGGLGFRLVLYFLALRGLADVASLHGLSLGLTAAAGILIGQVFEMRALERVRRGEIAASVVEGVDR